jgi:hypothetical protein
MTNCAELYPAERGSKFQTPQKTRVRSGTLASGITTKMNAFALHVAEGMSLADAYRQAFITANMKAKTIRDDASRLAQHPGVRAAIEAYRAEIEERSRISALERDERIWERLWHLIEDEEVPPTVKVKALDLAARLAGMFRTPKEIERFSAAQVEAELWQRLRGFESPVNGGSSSPTQP